MVLGFDQIQNEKNRISRRGSGAIPKNAVNKSGLCSRFFVVVLGVSYLVWYRYQVHGSKSERWEHFSIFVVLSWLLSFSVVFRTKSSRKFWRMRNNEYLWHRARQWIVKFPFIFFLCCESEVCTWYVPVCSASYAINNLFIWFQKNYPPRMYVNVCKWCQVSPSESQSKLGRNHYFLTKSANRKYNPTTQPHGVCTKYRSFTTFCGGNSVDDPNRQKPRHIT